MIIGVDASRATSTQRTGTENYSLYLIQALLEAGQAHRFRLYFNQPPSRGLFPHSERVEWRMIPFPRLWTHLRLSWEVGRHPPDVLFVPSHVLPLWPPRHCVATVHDLGYRHYPQAHTRRARWYLEWSTRYNARVAQRVIADSQATRDDLISCYGTDPSKIVVAYPAGAEGMAPVTDAARLQDVRQRYHTGECYFLHVGTIQPRKNLATLLRAYGALVAALQDSGQSAACEDGATSARLPTGASALRARLVLAGKRGWLDAEILELARKLGIEQNVTFTGYMPPEDLPALLSGALAYVLPSWYEGFGLPVLEAMACDTPVICSRVASLPEVAGDAALFFDPHDEAALTQALRRIYEDAALRQELIHRGRERVRAFSWRRCAQQVLSALEDAGREM